MTEKGHYECEYCGRESADSDAMGSHLEEQHQDEVRDYVLREYWDDALNDMAYEAYVDEGGGQP